MSNTTEPIPTNTKARQKRYHKRSPRACDECRLRKCKCDGLNPCGPCRLTGNDCTYDPNTVPVQKPTLRVRELEARLRSVRDLVQELRHRVLRDGSTGLSSELAALEEAVGLSSPMQSSPTAAILTPHSEENDFNLLLSMMGATGRRVMHHSSHQNFYGPISVFSFVCRILERFETHPVSDDDLHAAQSTIETLFNAALPVRGSTNHVSSTAQLPDQQHFMQLLDAAFHHCQPLGRLFHVDELRNLAIQFYNPGEWQHTASQASLIPLLHAVLSLEYLFDSGRHRHNGCGEETNAAMQHFHTAADHIDNIGDPSLLGIQTLLCLVIFLLNSSHMGRAHKYLGLACSSAIRLGLPSSNSFKVSQERRAVEIRVYSLLLEFDTYISILLDLPQILTVSDLHVSEMTTTGMYYDTVRGAEVVHAITSDEIEIELSKAHIHLMSITSKALQTAFQLSRSTASIELDNTRTALVDEKILKEADANFRAWILRLGPLLLKTDSSPVCSRFRPRLETTFYLSQLTLYYPFLHYLVPSHANKHISTNQSQIALSCIKIASIAILRFSKLHESGDLLPACWTTVHAIFVAVLCLIFLIAAHDGTSRPGEAWRRAELGIRLLASLRCTEWGAGACLDIIRLLITRLKHTVDFDMDQIVSTTRRLCDADTGSMQTAALPTHTLTAPRVTPQAWPSHQHRPSFTIQDLLIPDHPRTSLSQISPLSSTHCYSTATARGEVFPTTLQSTPSLGPPRPSSATSPTLLTQQQQQILTQMANSSSIWAKSPSSLTSAPPADIDMSSPPGSATGMSELPTSHFNNADTIFAQAQNSAHVIDFDQLLEV